MTPIHDVVVVGAGHAGCEAALAAARMGARTLVLTMNMDSIALMACNPSIGGTGKGHLVREIDALGGEMARAIDETLLQSRMLNTSKGAAVRSLRAQADKERYSRRMKRALLSEARITLRQAEIVALSPWGDGYAVTTATGEVISAAAVILAAGVYLNARVFIGDAFWDVGPSGMSSSRAFTSSLSGLGLTIRRFKTGTPARIDARSIDFDEMVREPGDQPITPFSFLTPRISVDQSPCYLTYTNERTHALIRENLHRSAMYSGHITGTGARYCPSIEDKVVRFADKERHPVFLEPETGEALEWYAQGLSSSLPEDVQRAMYRTIPGLRRAELLRLAYAIEYDVIDPQALTLSLASRIHPGIFFAGQINGTSGYEEAAAQGIIAGINAALRLRGARPFILRRSEAYIGVLIDDLITKGIDEPYRIMTSRAEYRLSLRQDNADLRLTEKAYRIGLATEERMERCARKKAEIARGEACLSHAFLPSHAVNTLIGGSPPTTSLTLGDLLKRGLPYASIAALARELPELSPASAEQIELMVRYQGYIERQTAQIERFESMEDKALPHDVDYHAIPALRIEARQKLAAQNPSSLGQASRVPGVSPGDIAVLMVWLSRQRGSR